MEKIGKKKTAKRTRKRDITVTWVAESLPNVVVVNTRKVSMKLRDSFCKVEFLCNEPKKKDCVYFMKTDKHEDCKYMDGRFCVSSVAQVNRMTIELKERLK